MEARQATLEQRPFEKNTTVIYCMDYDGCFDGYAIWLNPALKDMLSMYGLKQENWLQYVLEHSPIGQSILKAAQDPQTKRLVFVSLSNRQNLILDISNRSGNFNREDSFENGSAFAFMPKWREAVRDFLKDKGVQDLTVESCEHTMEDIWHARAAGTEYKRCETLNYPLAFINDLAELEKTLEKLCLTKEYQLENPAPYFDHSKISMIYALCHAFEGQYPGKKMVRFFDDRPEICFSVYHTFSNHEVLLPRSITLQVYHHDTYSPSFNPKEMLGKAPTTIINFCLIQKGSKPALHATEGKEMKLHFAPIEGAGPYDAQYQENVRKLHDMLKMVNLTDSGWKSLLKDYPMKFNKTWRTSDGHALIFHLTLSLKNFDALFGKKGTLENALKTFMQIAARSHSRGSTPGPASSEV